MKSKLLIYVFSFYLLESNVFSLHFPGPKVYVVTASPKHINEGRSPPFYYHNWMRRMDTVSNATSTTTTMSPREKTPDLIFAEFESDGSKEKSIRKLIEKERVTTKPTTMKPTTLKPSTSRPIYVPEEETHHDLIKPDPVGSKQDVYKPSSNNMFDDYYDSAPAPVYLPSTTPPTSTIKTSTPTTSTLGPINLQNIWHIIDNEKLNQQSGSWDESSLDSDNGHITDEQSESPVNQNMDSKIENEMVNEQGGDDEVKIDDNFALPGIGTHPGNGAENESRAIRTEPNLRFPYVNLKPFQMKKPHNILTNSKKSNMFNSLDNFYDLKQPIRGEAQDVVSMSQAIDRYNPAQPYLPKQGYDSKVSKQSSPNINPPKATANLVPPPPPPPPRITGDDFPSPSSYESFPPYAPISNFAPASAPKPASPPPPQPPQTSVISAPSIQTSIDADGPNSNSDDDGTVMDLGYRYKPPSGPPPFTPTIPPPPKPFPGYSYSKPNSPADLAPVDKPDFQGYQYKKPEPPPMMDQMPNFQGYQYNKPEPPTDMHDFQGYSYKKPDIPEDHKPHPAYDAPADTSDHDTPPPNHDSDYPELIFNKHHDDDKGGDDMKGHDMGMMPPPPHDMKSEIDDHGFPSDFPSDLKYHHDFEEHDHDHYHYHHPTTTTEMPRVNRYSYYYLGKKLYYLPLYFSVYFIVYVGALIIKAVLRHKIVYPNSWRPNTTTATFFSKRSVDAYLSNEKLHELTGKVTHAIATAAEKYVNTKSKTK